MGDLAFPFGGDYVFWEVWSLIIEELRNNLLTALFCMGLCCNFLLLHPGAAMGLVGMVIMAETMLFAYMATAGVALNSVTLAICVMSIGLIVDYCVSVSHSCLWVSMTCSDHGCRCAGSHHAPVHDREGHKTRARQGSLGQHGHRRVLRRLHDAHRLLAHPVRDV